jgi:hypothetical protein
MEQTLEAPASEETIESSVDLPHKDEFVPCMTCRNRSYLHFYFMDGLMSYCKHHGEKCQEGLEAAGGVLVFDNRESLQENRQKGPQ